jgi:hypothetical protein
VVLSWPASASGFELESSAAITGPWGPAGGSVTTVGENKRVELDPSGTARFFRLHKP